MKIADCHMHSFFSSDSEAPTEEMVKRVFASGSYGEALNIIGEYVNITDSREEKKHTPPHTRRGR